MPGKSLTPEQISEAATLRAAGYTLTAISVRLGISVSSLQRAFRRHPVKKATLLPSAIEHASQDLTERLMQDDRIKEEVARLLVDDLAHTSLLRDKAAATIEALNPSDTASAALTMRALVGYSTLLKNTSDTLRNSLGVSERRIHQQTALAELPELTVTEMTAAEITAIQRGQASEPDRAVEPLGDDDVIAESDEIIETCY
jgi:lambda repressor-like predicted transcriptional regulator